MKTTKIRNLHVVIVISKMKKKGFPSGSDGKESACSAGDTSSIPGLGGSPGEGNGNPLQYSGLETPTEEPGRGSLHHGVEDCRTGLSEQHFRFFTSSSQEPSTCLFSISA